MFTIDHLSQGEKAKERKDRRQPVLASGFKGGTAAREVAMIMMIMMVMMVMMIMMVMMMLDYFSSFKGGTAAREVALIMMIMVGFYIQDFLILRIHIQSALSIIWP